MQNLMPHKTHSAILALAASRDPCTRSKSTSQPSSCASCHVCVLHVSLHSTAGTTMCAPNCLLLYHQIDTVHRVFRTCNSFVPEPSSSRRKCLLGCETQEWLGQPRPGCRLERGAAGCWRAEHTRAPTAEAEWRQSGSTWKRCRRMEHRWESKSMSVCIGAAQRIVRRGTAG